MDTELGDYDLDYFESDEFDETDDERRRRRTRTPMRRVPRPSGQRLTPPAPQQGGVSRNEFNVAMERIRRELSATSAGLRTLEGRVTTLANNQDRMGRELTARRREAETLRRDLRQTREMSALLPLLTSQQRTATVAGTEVLVPSGNNLAAIAPILLLGSGDSTGAGGGMGGSDNSLLLMMLVLGMSR